ncbi:MAG: 2'-5' RNA ligase family protein [Actinomycetota bacterium]|nr:2'-5' RNA ligase family protein [Actinomycetota bacterium]
MPKVRLGVALLVPAPFAQEVDGLRRAVGDGSLGRIPAHLTLVPPVNVNRERLPDALRVLREAAAATRPFTVSTGAPDTFLPDNPVLYLPVEEGAPEIEALRDRVFQDPLARSLRWPFVPHITIADEAAPERIAAAKLALADYRFTATFERVHLLEQTEGRIWRAIADAPFEEPAVVGRGGLHTELSVTTILDPEASAIADLGDHRGAIVVTARRDGRVVGVLVGSAEDPKHRVESVAVIPEVSDEGIEDHLLGAFNWQASK